MKKDPTKILLGRPAPALGKADLPKILLGRLARGTVVPGETNPHKILLGRLVVGMDGIVDEKCEEANLWNYDPS